MKKTIAVASLALSTSLILAACGSDSEEATSSSTETSQEVEGTEDTDLVPTSPLEFNPEDLPDRVTEKEPEVNGSVVAPTTSENGAVQVSLSDDIVQVNYEPWFLECTDDPSANTLEELFSPEQSKFETMEIDYDAAYLEAPKPPTADTSELPEAIEFDDGSELTEAIDVDDLEDTPTDVGAPPIKKAVVLNGSDGLESVGAVVLEPQQAGTTELRVAYSCPTSGNSFDETWTLQIS